MQNIKILLQKNYNLELVNSLTHIKPDSKKVLYLGDDDDDIVGFLYNKTIYKQGAYDNVKNINNIEDVFDNKDYFVDHLTICIEDSTSLASHIMAKKRGVSMGCLLYTSDAADE